MTNVDATITSALKRSTLFRTSPAEILKRLALTSTTCAISRGEYLFRAGGRGTGVYVLSKGCLAITVGTPELHKVIEMAGVGAEVGLAAALLGVDETVNAEALADCSLILIPRSALLACAAENSQLAMLVAAALGRQVQMLIADIEAYSLQSGRQRVAEYLEHLAGSNWSRIKPFTLPAKKGVIASKLSLTPEYFSRVLHELISVGGISVNGRQITVLNPMRLRQDDASAAGTAQ